MGVDYKYLDCIKNPINNTTCLMFVYHEKFEHVFISWRMAIEGSSINSLVIRHLAN